MDDIIKLIQQVGFPIAVAIYLLWRYDQRLGDMVKCLTDIKVALVSLKEAIDNDDN